MTKADVRARLESNAVWRYGLSVVLVAAALAATYLLQPYVFRTPLFFLAIMISTWAGGTGPGLLAVLLSTLFISEFLSPRGIIETRFPHVPNVAAFLLTSLMVGAWSAARRRAEDALQRARDELEAKVEERTADLSRTNDRLQKEIDERKRAEEQLRRAEEQAHKMLDTIPQQIWSGPADGTLDYCNYQWRAYAGLGQEEIQGDGWQRMLHPDDKERVLRAWSESVATGKPYEQEERHLRTDGAYRWFLCRGVPMRDAGGRIERWFGTNTDITERRRAEEEVRRQKEIFQKIFNNAPLAITFFDESGRLLLVNRAWERMFGWTLNELEELNLDPFVEALPDPRERQRAFDFMAVGTGEWDEFKARTRDGRTIDVYAAAVRLSDGTSIGLVQDITERKQAEERLRQTERELRLVIDTIPANAWSTLPDGSLDFVNQRLLDDLGISFPDSAGWNWTNLVHPEDVTEVVNRWRASLASHEPMEVEARVRRADGEYIWYLIRDVPLKDDAGNVVRWYGTATDITERKRAEETLDERLRFETLLTELSATFANMAAGEVDQEIDKWLRSLAESLNVDRATFFHVGENGTTLYRGHSYTVPGIEPLPLTELNGQFPWATGQLLQGKTIKWPRVPDDIPEQATQEKAVATRVGVKSALSVPVFIGGSVICALSFTSIRAFRNWPDEMVARLRLVGEIFANAVARKRAEEALRESEELYRFLTESSNDLICLFDSEGRLVYESPSFQRLLGTAPGHPFDGIHPDDLQAAEETWRRLLRGEKTYLTFRRTDAGGSWHWLEALGSLVHYRGEPHVMGVTRDITERKRAEEALRLFRSLLDQSSDAIEVIDPDTLRFLDCNESAYQSLGYSRAEFLSLSVPDIDPTIDPPRLTWIEEEMSNSGFVTFESLHLRKDGSVFPVEVNVKVVRQERDYRLAVVRDITERKQAEEMLQTFSQRLIETQEAERRRVARELHDEIGQALTAIKINLQAVQHSAGASPLAQQLNESAGIVDRALQQVRDLSFDLRPSLLDDLGLIAALRWYVDREARRAGLIPEFVADSPETRLPLELETACFRITQEALTNVVRHAQAMRIWVELRRRGAELHLTIRDDGIGFDVGSVWGRRVSDAGLGLQGMQERASILNGKIEVKSAPSHGTEIHVWFSLPAIPSSAKKEGGGAP